MDQEQDRPVDVFPVLELVFDIVRQALIVFAPVLFAYPHFALFQLNAGLQVEKIRAQGCHHRAAAALDHIVQPVQYEAGFHLPGVFLQLGGNFLQALGSFCQTAGLQDHKAVARTQVPGIYHPDVVEALGGDGGILVTGGEAGAQADVNHAVVVLGVLGKQLLINGNASGSGGAEISAGIHMGEDVVGGDGYVV